MNSQQPFNASNQLGTCLWCGRPVTKGRDVFGLGLFDVESCATQFGLALARWGRRLKPRKPKGDATP